MTTIPPHAENNNLIPQTSGIYKITCTANGKIYVGSSVNLLKRKRDHFSYLRCNKHRNSKLQRAWNKYGPDAFVFEILELVLIPELLTVREQYWFNKLKPFRERGFNIAREAASPALGHTVSPESRIKMGLPHIGNTYRLGRRAKPETIERLSASHRGKPSTFKGKHHTPEAREKLREARSHQQFTPESNEKRAQKLRGRTRQLKQNTYRTEGNITYIILTMDREAMIDTADLEHVLKVKWLTALHNNKKNYQARGAIGGKPIFLSRYILASKEDEIIIHLNGDALDNRRANLRIAQPGSYHRNTRPNSKTGIYGVSIDKYTSGTLIYNFRCRICKISKNFPYTEEGLATAKAFAEAHHAAMKKGT